MLRYTRTTARHGTLHGELQQPLQLLTLDQWLRVSRQDNARLDSHQEETHRDV